MPFTVTVHPSGHTFEPETRESVLQAGLRAGLNLSYSCDNGTCGSCRARLISGQLEAMGHQDFVLSEAQRAVGEFLMCCHRPASDITLEAREIKTASEIPLQSLQAKVSKIERLQEEMIRLEIRTPRSRELQFLAGQSVGVRFSGLPSRVLPIASCPCDALHLRFHLRYRRGDTFTEYVFNGLRRGQEVALEGPVGGFSLDTASTRPLLLVAWEYGFAPIQSLIEHAIQLNPDRKILLYWLSALPGGHYLSNNCRAWADALDDFHYHSIDLAPHGEWDTPMICDDILSKHAPLSDWDVYLAVPNTYTRFRCAITQGDNATNAQIKVCAV